MRLLTSKQAAEILHVHPETVRDWARKGYIQSSRTDGGHLRFSPSEVARVAAEQKALLEGEVPTPATDDLAANLDKRYLAYVQTKLDYADNEHRKAPAEYRKHRRWIIGCSLVAVISVAFVVVGIVVASDLLWFFGGMFAVYSGAAALFNCEECEIIARSIREYEAMSCTERVRVYVQPYEKWRSSTKVEADQMEAWAEERQKVCATLSNTGKVA